MSSSGLRHTANETTINTETSLNNRIFLGCLTDDLEEFSIFKYCSAYGDISKCQIMKDSESCESRGFGFITYLNPKSAAHFLASAPHYIGDRRIVTKMAHTFGQTLSNLLSNVELLPQTRRIFICYIVDEKTAENLEAEPLIVEYLSKFGIIKGITHQFATNSTAKSSTVESSTHSCCQSEYWIVEFLDAESVQNCMSQIEHLLDSGLRLEIKRVYSSEEIIKRKREFHSSAGQNDVAEPPNQSLKTVEEPNIESVSESAKEYVAAPIVFSGRSAILGEFGYQNGQNKRFRPN